MNLQFLFNGVYLGGDPEFDGLDDTVQSALPLDARDVQEVAGARWSTRQYFDRANRSHVLTVNVTRQFANEREALDFMLRYAAADDHGWEGTAILRAPYRTSNPLLDTDGNPVLDTDGNTILDATDAEAAWNWIYRDAVLSFPLFSPPVGSRVSMSFTVSAASLSLSEDADLPMWDVNTVTGRSIILYPSGVSSTWTRTGDKYTHSAGSDSIWTLTGDKLTLA